MSTLIRWQDFQKIEMRVGTVLEAALFKEAHKPALKLLIDFGDYGCKKSSAQITDYYKPQDLLGRQVVAVVNFPAKQIGPLMSECLVLGAETEAGIILLAPEQQAPNGSRIG